MLGLKEVANKNIMRKEEEDRKIETKKNIEKMFVDFINANLNEIHEFFPTTKFYGTTFRVTQRDSLSYSNWDNYSIEMTRGNKIVIKRVSNNLGGIEIPFKLDDNKSVLYGKFKNAIRTLVSIGYDPEKDSKLVK